MNFYESKKWPKIFSEYFYKLDDKTAATWTEELFNGPKKIYNLTDDEVCEALYTFVDDRDRPKILKLTHLRIRIFRQRGAQSKAVNMDRMSAQVGWYDNAIHIPVLELKKKIAMASSDDEIWDIACSPNDDEICRHLLGYAGSVHKDFDAETVRKKKLKEFSDAINAWVAKAEKEEPDNHSKKINQAKQQLKAIKERDAKPGKQ